MQTIRWYRLFAIGALAAPVVVWAQAPGPGPQPKITEIATIPGTMPDEYVRMPNGRILIYGAGDSIVSYDLISHHGTLLTLGWDSDLALSRSGDRLAYTRPSEDGKDEFVWSMPLDPRTGLSAGLSQRVSISHGWSPHFSPDGKQIAFAADRGKRVPSDASPANRLMDVVIVPAIGGAERVVASYPRRIAPIWSDDGQWIYVQSGTFVGDVRVIERVSVAGGKSEVLRAFSHQGMPDGFLDGRVAFYLADTHAGLDGRLAYETASGTTGELHFPRYAIPSITSSSEIAIRVERPSVFQVLNLENGKVRDLPAEKMPARNPTWSPDMKRLAYSAGEGEQQEIVVANADGSGQRRFSFKGGPTVFNGQPSWSPDGRTLIFDADDGRNLQALDLASGRARTLASVTAPSRIGTRIAWRPDGVSFLTQTAAVSAAGKGSQQTVIELRLDGSRRVVRELWREFPLMVQSFTVSDKLVAVETGDSTAPDPTGIYLVPLDGGRVRQIAMPHLTPGTRLSFVIGVSDKWLIMNVLDKSNHVVGIQAMSTGSDSTRLLPASPNQYTPAPNLLLNDGNHLVRIGESPTGTDYAVYSIPLDGTPERVIGHIADPRRAVVSWGSGLSPTGTLFAFFSRGTPNAHVYDVDLTSVLQTLVKH
jgi:Tol biopolymer transport system component